MMTKSSWLLRYIVRTTERCIVSVKCRCQGSCVQPMGLLYHPLSLLLNCSNAGGCEQPIPLRMHFTYLSHTRLNIRVSQNMVTPSPVLVSTQGGKINLHQTGHCSFQVYHWALFGPYLWPLITWPLPCDSLSDYRCSMFQQQRVSVCVWEDGESEISSGDDDLGTLSRYIFLYRNPVCVHSTAT